ncbi:pheST operon leader peptide PheM [Erwinia sp. 198]|nr:pheST operon leader peptide PheM [Erwinia sp. 198]
MSVSFFTLAPEHRGLVRKEKKRKIALKASLVEAFLFLARQIQGASSSP